MSKKVLQIHNHLDGSWEKFEQWVRKAIGSDFRWRIRMMDTRAGRQMLAGLVQKNIEENNGHFPEKNSYIERTSQER